QYKALLKEYQDAQKAAQEALGKAKTNEEQQKVFREKWPRPDKYAPRFLALAEKHPKDPAAVDALVWVASNRSGRGADSPQAKALAILQRDHAANPKLGPVCQQLTYNLDKASETLLRAVLEKGATKEVKAGACLALAQFLKNRSSTLEQLKAQPQFEAAYAQM